jgi:hypothetical protein
MQTLAYLLARFSEPSSYAGFGAVLALIGWNLPEPVLAQISRRSPRSAPSSLFF